MHKEIKCIEFKTQYKQNVVKIWMVAIATQAKNLIGLNRNS